MVNETLFCPITGLAQSCKVYNNWIRQMKEKDNRLDIIFYDDGKYSYKALDDTFNRKSGIEVDKELKDQLGVKKPECVLIELLNNTKK